jgi:hypothetical protein
MSTMRQLGEAEVNEITAYSIPLIPRISRGRRRSQSFANVWITR